MPDSSVRLRAFAVMRKRIKASLEMERGTSSALVEAQVSKAARVILSTCTAAERAAVAEDEEVEWVGHEEYALAFQGEMLEQGSLKSHQPARTASDIWAARHRPLITEKVAAVLAELGVELNTKNKLILAIY